MPELVTYSPELVAANPFGEPDHDDVAAAVGIFYAVDGYMQAMEQGVVILDEGVTPDMVMAVHGIAEYRLGRAKLAAVPGQYEAAESVKVKHLRHYDARADASTGAYEPVKLTGGRETTSEYLEELCREGEEMAALEASEGWKYDASAYADVAEFDYQDQEIIKSALRYRFLGATEDWQRLEAIWLADRHGFDDIAEELSALNWEHGSRVPPDFLDGIATAVTRTRRMVHSLSRLTAFANLMF